MSLFDIFKKKSNVTYNKNEILAGNMPVHIAFIMDGNGRWAKKRGLTRSMGHSAGAATFKSIAKLCAKIGIKYMTVYAFSTENWSRPKEEVDALMELLYDYLDTAEKGTNEDNIALRIIGDKSILSQKLRDKITSVEEKSSVGTAMVCNIAINYSGRNDIMHAMQQIGKQVKNGELEWADITEDTITKKLYTAHCPDPDLIVRTSGETRVSNFLLWQSAYSEYYFEEKLWPDFNEKQLLKAIYSFQNRDRRFGKL